MSGYRLGIATLPLAPSVRAKLEAAGFTSRGDLENIGPIDLARGAFPADRREAFVWALSHTCAEAELTHEEALSVLQESSRLYAPGASALPGALARSGRRLSLTLL